jgi:outer membrane immunogenic protein
VIGGVDMNKLIIGSAAFFVLTASPVSAADLLVKKPIYQAPIYTWNWTGFYVGGAVGGKWSNTNWITTSTSDFPGTIVDASSPRTYRPSGFRAGGYTGYSWQIASWVVGLEADLAWADNTVTSAGVPGCAILCFPGAPGPGVDVTSVKMGWDASVRARLGYLMIPDLLIYGTGGVAWQNIETSGTCQHSVADPQCTAAAGNPFDTQTNTVTLTGWTIGGGLEKMYGNWLLRGEYRYSRFGNLNGVFNFGAPGAPPGTDTSRYDLSVNTNIVTVNLAYKFGGPLVAKY